jgi:hypothetical protein
MPKRGIWARQSLALESRRADLRNQYFDRFHQAVPGLTVAKFFQSEHRTAWICSWT